MKKERIIALSILGFIMFSFLISVVSAQELLKSPMIDKIQEISKKIFANDKTYDYFKNILSPEILFGILIFFVIFAIISTISIFKSKLIRITLSIVIAILSAGFIPVEWINPLLNQYEAIGVLITLGFPFVLIFLFLKNAAPENALVHRIVFSAFFIITLINFMINIGKIDQLTIILYVGILILNAVMILWSSEILKFIWKAELQSAFDKAEEIRQLVAKNELQKAKEALENAKGLLPAGTVQRMQGYIAKKEAAAKK